MKPEKFKVIDFIRELIVVIDIRLDNFPKKELEIKNRIKSNSYDLLELAYEANSIENIEKKKELIYKMLAKVKVIDFLVNLSLDRDLIAKKHYLKLGARLDDIARYTGGWLKSLNQAESSLGKNKNDEDKGREEEETLPENVSNKNSTDPIT